MNLPAWLRTQPDFLIVGTQKGGTTSLYQYLSQHPAVLPASNKEVNYFGDRYANGIAWYKSRFPSRYRRYRRSRETGERVLTGEATPFYLFHPLAPRRVREALPDVRIIAMLRNPIDRAFSHHAYHVKLGVETLAFEAAIDAEPKRLDGELARMLADESYPGYSYKMFSYLERGIYAPQLERWFEHFDRSRVLIVRSEDFFADSDACYKEVQRFLGLPAHTLPAYRTFNEREEVAGLEPQTRQRLCRFFEPHNRRLNALVSRDFQWS